MSEVTGFSRQQIILHWVTVVLVALQYIMHEGIADAFDQGIEAGTLTLSGPAIGHMAGGLIVFLLTVWRLMIRNERGVPRPPEEEPQWARMASHAAHWGFYALLFALPVTGGLAWGMASEALGEVHEVLRAVLLFLIVAHIGAVVVHQLVWKTGLVTRMMRAED